MVAYNLTNFTASNGVVDIMVASNQMTSGVLGVIIVLIIFTISFTSMSYRASPISSLASSCIVTFLICIPLYVFGVISATIFYLLMTATGASFVLYAGKE